MWRYDIFFRYDVLEPCGDVSALHEKIVAAISVPAEDFFWETDEQALRMEMKRNGTNSPDVEGYGLFWGGRERL